MSFRLPDELVVEGLLAQVDQLLDRRDRDGWLSGDDRLRLQRLMDAAEVAASRADAVSEALARSSNGARA